MQNYPIRIFPCWVPSWLADFMMTIQVPHQEKLLMIESETEEANKEKMVYIEKYFNGIKMTCF